MLQLLVSQMGILIKPNSAGHHPLILRIKKYNIVLWTSTSMRAIDFTRAIIRAIGRSFIARYFVKREALLLSFLSGSGFRE